MRDLALFAVVFGSIPFILRKPYIGVLMWVWLSVMNPHRLVWSFAYGFNFAAIIAIVTLVSVMLTKDKKVPPVNGLTVILFLFVGWTGITTLFAWYPQESFEIWTTLMKTQLMAFLIPVLFHRKEHVRWLIWVIVLSVAYYGIKGGVFTLVVGGENRVWGPTGTYIEDNNALATAVVMIIPLLRYLQITYEDKRVRVALTGAMVLCGLSVLGSQSRGAFVAVSMMVFFLIWKSRQRLQLIVALVLLIPAALAFMPEKWFHRMDTIANYEQDTSGSASMRLNSWGTMFNIAKDRVTGGGFEVATRQVYDYYAPDKTFNPQVAHSIYFQAMGEHGFIGFFLYVLLCYTFWRHAGALAQVTRGYPSLAWAHNFGLMMQVSLVGFLTGGAFLSLILFDVPYYLIGTVLAVRALVDKELLTAGPAAKPVRVNPYTSIPPRRSPTAGNG